MTTPASGTAADPNNPQQPQQQADPNATADPNASGAAPPDPAAGQQGQAAADPNATADGGAGDGSQPGTDTVEYWKQRSRENERKSRANAAAAAELNKIKQAQMSDLEKAQQAQKEAEARAQAAEESGFRSKAANAHGLPPQFVDYLGGGEEAEIDARAEDLAKHLNGEVAKGVAAKVLELTGIDITKPQGRQPGQMGSLGQRPSQALRSGVQVGPNGQQTDPNAWFRGMLPGQNR